MEMSITNIPTAVNKGTRTYQGGFSMTDFILGAVQPQSEFSQLSPSTDSPIEVLHGVSHGLGARLFRLVQEIVAAILLEHGEARVQQGILSALTVLQTHIQRVLTAGER
jgi:hypothetical protein